MGYGKLVSSKSGITSVPDQVGRPASPKPEHQHDGARHFLGKEMSRIKSTLSKNQEYSFQGSIRGSHAQSNMKTGSRQRAHDRIAGDAMVT